jgi:hypothetical protein
VTVGEAFAVALIWLAYQAQRLLPGRQTAVAEE